MIPSIKTPLIAFAFCVVVVASYGLLRAGQRQVTLYYTPFELVTLYAITPENIEQGPYNVIRLNQEDERWRALSRVLNRSVPGKFDAMNVRLKIRLPNGGSVLIDREGGIRREKMEARLEGAAFHEVIRVMKVLAPHDF